MGEDATGFIMYHPEGFMSAQMMSAGRPKYASEVLHSGTQEEMVATAEAYLAYAGLIKKVEKLYNSKKEVAVATSFFELFLSNMTPIRLLEL